MVAKVPCATWIKIKKPVGGHRSDLKSESLEFLDPIAKWGLLPLRIISRSALFLRAIPVAFLCLQRYPSVSLVSHGSAELPEEPQGQHSPGTVWIGDHYSRLLDQGITYWNKILLRNWNIINIYKISWTHKEEIQSF